MPIEDIVKDVVRGGQQDWAKFSNVPGYLTSITDALKQSLEAGGGRMGYATSRMNQGISPELAPSHVPFSPESSTMDLPSSTIPSHIPAPVTELLSKADQAVKKVEGLPTPPGGSAEKVTEPPPTPEEKKASEDEATINTFTQMMMQNLKDLRDIIEAIKNALPKAEGDTRDALQAQLRDLYAAQEKLNNVTFGGFTPQPKPPEIQSTEKNLGIMSAIIPGIMAIAAIMGGGQSGINFADMYNGMVGAWRARDFDEFEKETINFNSKLQAVKQENDKKLLEYNMVLERAVRGLDVGTDIALLEMKKAKLPLENLQSMADLSGKMLESLNQIVNLLSTKELKKAMMSAEQQQHNFMNYMKMVEVSFKKRTLELKEKELGGGADLANATPQQKTIAKGMANYSIPMPSGFALRSPFWQKVVGLAQQINPSFDASQYPVRQKLKQDFTSGNASKNIRSLNTAVGHLESMMKSGKALQNSSLQVWNWIKNKGLEAAGDPRVDKFLTDANAVAGELATVFKNTSGTDQEIKSWKDRISEAKSPAQIKGIGDEAVELLGSRLQALQNQYETGLGEPKDFHFLSPKARKILGDMGVNVAAWDRATRKEEGVAPSRGGATRTISRTGTLNGRKVVEYSDGDVEYAD